MAIHRGGMPLPPLDRAVELPDLRREVVDAGHPASKLSLMPPPVISLPEIGLDL